MSHDTPSALIRQASEAQEAFSLDELEAYAETLRQKPCHRYEIIEIDTLRVVERFHDLGLATEECNLLNRNVFADSDCGYVGVFPLQYVVCKESDR